MTNPNMTTAIEDRLSLVADIGGTNTRVALARGKELLTGSIRRFRNADFPGLEPVLTAYIAAEGAPPCGAVCVAAAGPVAHGVATMTNLDWKIDGASLTRATGARRTAILNDLQAQGHALGHIAPENLRTVIEAAEAPSEAPAEATKLVIGIGTGFNAAPVYETPVGRLVAASECGHVNLPVRTAADLRLAHFVETAHGFPGVEDVLSGRGLERLYTFVTSEAGRPETRDAAGIMAAIASENGDGPASQTARLFVRLCRQPRADPPALRRHLPLRRCGACLFGIVRAAGLCRGFPRQGPLCRVHVSVFGQDHRGRLRCPHRIGRLSVTAPKQSGRTRIGSVSRRQAGGAPHAR